MTFTELEAVLLFALVILLAFHFAQRSLIATHRTAHYWMMKVINDAADKKVAFYRTADGAIGVKPIQSMEKPHETSQQAGQGQGSDRS